MRPEEIEALKKYLRSIWVAAECVVGVFYLSLGTYYTSTSGPYTLLTLFRVSFLNNYYYPASAGSLVIFGLYGLFLVFHLRAWAAPMFLITYASFELIAFTWNIYGITLVIAAVGIASYWILKPKLNWRSPVAWVLLWVAFSVALFSSRFGLPNLNFLYELVVIAWSLLFFSPRRQERSASGTTLMVARPSVGIHS